MKYPVLIMFVIVLLFFSSCHPKEDITTDNNIDILNDKISELEDKLITLTEKYAEVQSHNTELITEITMLDERIEHLEGIGIESRLNEFETLDSRLDEVVNQLAKPLYSNLHILDNNIKKLFAVSSLDEEEYMAYSFEYQLEYATTFDQLMELYSYQLDGIYAESFGSVMGDIYLNSEFTDLIDGISKYTNRIADDLCQYLVYDVIYREGGRERLIADIEDYIDAYGSNEVILKIQKLVDDM